MHFIFEVSTRLQSPILSYSAKHERQANVNPFCLSGAERGAGVAESLTGERTFRH